MSRLFINLIVPAFSKPEIENKMQPLCHFNFFYSTIYHIHLQKGSKQENLQQRERVVSQ